MSLGLIGSANEHCCISVSTTHLFFWCWSVCWTQNLTTPQRLALSIISYIGCIISIVCLLLSVLFFLTFGSVVVQCCNDSCCLWWSPCSKQLFVAVHNFVHLNLAIALLLGLIVFVAGIETAVGNRVSVLQKLYHHTFMYTATSDLIPHSSSSCYFSFFFSSFSRLVVLQWVHSYSICSLPFSFGCSVRGSCSI